MTRVKCKKFRDAVWGHWKSNGRHDLAWRSPSLKLRRTEEILDPYKILVSEIMLQQTQVPRVKEKYREFLKAFPSVRALAKAPLADVLRHWSGLGYNRRGKYLHDAAKMIVAKHKGRVPSVYNELVELPGVGDYTARAVRVFAFNEPDILIETNIRTVYIYEFQNIWTSDVHISDVELLPLVARGAEGQNPREWNWALMDYGAHIKKLHGNPARRSKHYTKQSKFEGSLRQVRGAILKALAHEVPLEKVRNQYAEQFEQAYTSLVREGLVAN